MLSKLRKLSRRELQIVFQTGQTVKTNLLTLKYVQNSQAFSRFAVIVSTKVFARAHDRNNIKRHVYQIISDFSSNLDVVIILHPRVVNLNNEEIDTNVHQVLSKISLV